MGADNWGKCPQCCQSAVLRKQKDLDKAAAAYGKVSAEEYLKLLAATEAPIRYEPTLREDYEIYTDEEGVFAVSYRASCTKCGFSHNFAHSEQLKIKGDKDE